MFPVDKRTAQMVWYPAPDVIPQICFAVDDVPMSLWNSTDDLYELAEAIAPYLDQHGARKWDFIWSMERHFSAPYGPLPKAKQTFMAGIPDIFLEDRGLSDGSAIGSRLVEEGVLGEQAGLNVVRQDDVEVVATPFQYEADSPDMSDEYRFWLEKLFIAHGECMMPYFGESARGHRSHFAAQDDFAMTAAPTPEARLRVNNFISEEFKHTYQFFKVYNEFDPRIPVRIYEHEREVFRAYQAMTTEPTWIDKSLNNMLSDRFGVYQGFEWVQSSYAPLARVSLKVVKDERGHSNMGYLNVRECIEEEGEAARREVQRRMDEYWYPYFMAAFGSTNSKNNLAWRKWGLKQHTNDELRRAYHHEVTLVLESLGVQAPDMDKALERGLELAGRSDTPRMVRGS